MIHPHTELRFISDEVGHGVFATRPIPKGTIVWTICSLDQRVSPERRATLPESSRELLDLYAYLDSAGTFILCWDHGRYVNHSCEPAMMAIGQEHEIAVRDIAVGEELTCDYGTLNLLNPLVCSCGSSACRSTIGRDDLDTTDLATRIDLVVASAMGRAALVDQPLVAYMQRPDVFRKMMDGSLAPPSVQLCSTTAERGLVDSSAR
jgi:uncharacterized protein